MVAIRLAQPNAWLNGQQAVRNASLTGAVLPILSVGNYAHAFVAPCCRPKACHLTSFLVSCWAPQHWSASGLCSSASFPISGYKKNRLVHLQHSSWSAIWVRSIVAVVLPASLDDSKVGGLTAWHKKNVNNVVVPLPSGQAESLCHSKKNERKNE